MNSQSKHCRSNNSEFNLDLILALLFNSCGNFAISKEVYTGNRVCIFLCRKYTYNYEHQEVLYSRWYNANLNGQQSQQ